MKNKFLILSQIMIFLFYFGCDGVPPILEVSVLMNPRVSTEYYSHGIIRADQLYYVSKVYTIDSLNWHLHNKSDSNIKLVSTSNEKIEVDSITITADSLFYIKGVIKRSIPFSNVRYIIFVPVGRDKETVYINDYEYKRRLTRRSS
jgi:hypothetical protein